MAVQGIKNFCFLYNRFMETTGQTGGTEAGIYKELDEYYKKLALFYAPAVREPREEVPLPEIGLDRDIKAFEYALPTEEMGRIVNFSKRASLFLDPRLFTDRKYHPTSGIHLRAILANIYNQEEDNQKQADRSLYIRATASTVSSFIGFTNFINNKNTNFYVQEFIQGDFTRVKFAEFLTKMLGATMPVISFSQERKIATYQKYCAFLQRLSSEVERNTRFLEETVKTVLPENSTDQNSAVTPPVFVQKILREAPISNLQEVNDREKYNTINAAAITFGVDPVTGLPLVVHELPYNYDMDAKVDLDEFTHKPMQPRHDPVYKAVATLLHEKIHNLNEHEVSGDFESIVAELLTDSAASIVQLRANGKDFVHSDFSERAAGYPQWVNLAVGLVEHGLVTEEQLLNFGFRQDPGGFLRFLDQKIAAAEDGTVLNIARELIDMRLIWPVKRAQLPERVKEIKDLGFSKFLEKEVKAMWENMGSAYMAQPHYTLDVLNDIRKTDPGYFDRMRKLYQDFRPGLVIESEGVLLRDPRDKMLSDEFIERFQKMFDPSKKASREHPFWDRGELAKFLEVHISDVKASDQTIPDPLRLNGESDPEGARALVSAVNDVLGRLYYKVEPETEKPKVLLSVSAQLYTNIAGVLEKNWRQNGIDFSQEDVLRVIIELVPSWYSIDSKPASLQDFLQDTTERISALTSPFYPDGNLRVVPSKTQVFHFGRAARLEESVQ